MTNIKFNNDNLIYDDIETGEKYTTLYSIYHKLGYMNYSDFQRYRDMVKKYIVNNMPSEQRTGINECITEIGYGCCICDLIIPITKLKYFRTSHDWGHPINKLIDSLENM